MNSRNLLRAFIKETVEDLFNKQFSKRGRIGKVAFEKEIITRLTKEKIVQKINSGSSITSQDQYLSLIIDAVSDVKNFIETIFNSIVGDNVPTFELEGENRAFRHLHDSFVNLLNEALDGVSDEDVSFVINFFYLTFKFLFDTFLEQYCFFHFRTVNICKQLFHLFLSLKEEFCHRFFL